MPPEQGSQITRSQEQGMQAPILPHLYPSPYPMGPYAGYMHRMPPYPYLYPLPMAPPPVAQGQSTSQSPPSTMVHHHPYAQAVYSEKSIKNEKFENSTWSKEETLYLIYLIKNVYLKLIEMKDHRGRKKIWMDVHQQFQERFKNRQIKDLKIWWFTLVNEFRHVEKSPNDQKRFEFFKELAEVLSMNPSNDIDYLSSPEIPPNPYAPTNGHPPPGYPPYPPAAMNLPQLSHPMVNSNHPAMAALPPNYNPATTQPSSTQPSNSLITPSHTPTSSHNNPTTPILNKRKMEAVEEIEDDEDANESVDTNTDKRKKKRISLPAVIFAERMLEYIKERDKIEDERREKERRERREMEERRRQEEAIRREEARIRQEKQDQFNQTLLRLLGEFLQLPGK